MSRVVTCAVALLAASGCTAVASVGPTPARGTVATETSRPTEVAAEPADDEVSRVVRRRRPELASCWDRALRRSRGGRVTVRFSIAPDGSVATVRILRSTLEDDSVPTCVASVVARWRFAPRRASLEHEETFIFVDAEGAGHE